MCSPKFNYSFSPKQELTEVTLPSSVQASIGQPVSSPAISWTQSHYVLFQRLEPMEHYCENIPLPHSPSEARLLLATAWIDYGIHITQKISQTNWCNGIYYDSSTTNCKLNKLVETLWTQNTMSAAYNWWQGGVDTMLHAWIPMSLGFISSTQILMAVSLYFYFYLPTYTQRH